MSQNMERILHMYNHDYLDAKDGTSQQIMQAISKIKDPLTKIKMVQALAPTMFAMSGGHPILNKLSAIAMGSNAITGDSYLKRMDQQSQLKAINRLEKQVGYGNATGDTAFRTISGINNIGMSVGVTGSILKGLGQAGYVPNVMQHVNPLMLMGAMQGGKGIGTMAAGAAGGMGGLGTALGAGGAGMMGMMNPAMLGVMAMMAMNMGGSKVTDMMLHAGSTNVRKFRASVNLHLTSGTQLELEYSNMVQISSQIKMMSNMNLLTPAETLQANILMMIESHTSVLAPMLAEMRNETEKKHKLGGNAGQNVASDFFSEDGLLSLQNQKGTRKNPNFLQRGAKHFAQFATNLSSVVDVFGQIGNTLSGKSSSALFNEANRQKHSTDATQEFSDKFGIAVSMVNTIHTSAAEVLSKADSFEAKQISILAGIYELNRFQGHELLSIRKDGLGVERPGHTGELARMRVQEEADDGELETFGKMLDEMMGYIPLWHTISGSAKMVMAGYKNMEALITSNSNPFTSMLREIGDVFTKSFTQVVDDEGTLRNTIGAVKLSPSDLMARYLSGDYIKQMSELINYNKAQAHYLRYLADAEAGRNGDGHVRAPQYNENLTMDEFSGKLLNSKQLKARNNKIGLNLKNAIRSTAPNGFLGMIMTSLGLDSKDKAEEYSIRKFGHIKELHEQFGNTFGYTNRRGFSKGTGDTGKAAPGTKPDESGEKPVGPVHEGEAVIPNINKQPGFIKSLINSILPKSSPKVSLTSEDKAKALNAEAVQANEALNVAKQTDIQTGSLKMLKDIKESNEIIAGNTKKEKDKPKGGLFDGLLKLGDWLFKGLTTGFGMFGLLTKAFRLLPAVMEAGFLAVKYGKTLLAKAAASFGRMGIPGFTKIEDLAVDEHGPLMPGQQRATTDLARGEHGPLRPGDTRNISFMDKAKGWLSDNTGKVTDTLKAKKGDFVKDIGGAKGFVGKSAWLAAFYAGADYFLQDDENEDGTQKSVTDKLKTVGQDLLGSAGGIMGSVIGGSLGSVLMPVGGTIIGGIIGGILGDMAQKKVIEWWEEFTTADNGKKMGLVESAGYYWGSLSDNTKWGLGIGGAIGMAGGPIGALAGGLIGAYVADDVVIVAKDVSKWFGDIKDSTISTLSDLGEDLKNLPGVETGMTLGRKVFGDNWFGSLLGGLVGGAIGGLGWLGEKAGKILSDVPSTITETKNYIIDKATNAKVYLTKKGNEWINAAGNVVDAAKGLFSEKVEKPFNQGVVEGNARVGSNVERLKLATGQTYSVSSGTRNAKSQYDLFMGNEAGAVSVASDHYGGAAEDIKGNLLNYLKTNYLENKSLGNRSARFKKLNEFLKQYNLQTYDEGGTNGVSNIHLENIGGMDKIGLATTQQEASKFINMVAANSQTWLNKIKSDPAWAAKRKLTGITTKAQLLKNLNDRSNFKLSQLGAGTVNLNPDIIKDANLVPPDTSTGQAAVNIEKQAAADKAKKQTSIQKQDDEKMVSMKEHNESLKAISNQLAIQIQQNSEMSANQSALVAAADKASTLWSYIEEVYSTPTFNDAQFSAIKVRS